MNSLVSTWDDGSQSWIDLIFPSQRYGSTNVKGIPKWV